MIRVLSLFTLLTFMSSAQASFTPEEVRLGVFKHDIRSGCRHHIEKGYDINGELLWKSPDFEPFKFLLSPRPHIGTSINTQGGTNQFYFGITWRLDFLSYGFVEVAFGGDYNTGEHRYHKGKKKALGSRFMFREGIELGVQMTPNHSLSVILDHTSNAGLGCCNPGLTGLGVRYGYRF